MVSFWTSFAAAYPVEPEPEAEVPVAAPGPAIPYEVHNTTPVNPQRAWDAVVAMCRAN
jgi:hypothetical protein